MLPALLSLLLLLQLLHIIVIISVVLIIIITTINVIVVSIVSIVINITGAMADHTVLQHGQRHRVQQLQASGGVRPYRHDARDLGP